MYKWISMVLCLIAMSLLSACGGGNNAAPTTTAATKGVAFSLSRTALVSAKAANKTVNATVPTVLDPTATAAVMTVADSAGNLKDYRSDIYSLGGNYVTATIQLAPDSYTLTKFLVLDSNNNILYLVPTQEADGDIKALVSTVLPVNFTVTTDGTNTVPLQVVAPEDSTATNFGYPSVSFSVVNYVRFMSVIQTLDDTNGWQVLGANLTVNGVNYNHPAQTTTLRVAQADNYTLVFSKSGYATKTVTLNAAELANYQMTPRVITLTRLAPPQNFTITFGSNGGTSIAPQTVADHGLAILPTNPSKPGYSFAYWYSANESIPFDFNTPIISDLTLHAKWAFDPSRYHTWNVATTVPVEFTVPAGVTKVAISVVGADGGLGGYVYNDSTGAGGRGGWDSRVSYNGTRLCEAKGGDGEHGEIGDDSPDLGEPELGHGVNYCILGADHYYTATFDHPLTIVVGKGGASGADGMGNPNDLPPGKDGSVTIMW
jgi:uncharacterized repeat protein (TIGR02543 family)